MPTLQAGESEMLSFFLRLSRTKLLLVAAAMILAVALIDWRVELNVSFGFLYLFPMLIVGSCLPRWQLALLGGLCTFLAERFAPFYVGARSRSSPRHLHVRCLLWHRALRP